MYRLNVKFAGNLSELLNRKFTLFSHTLLQDHPKKNHSRRNFENGKQKEVKMLVTT